MRKKVIEVVIVGCGISELSAEIKLQSLSKTEKPDVVIAVNGSIPKKEKKLQKWVESLINGETEEAREILAVLEEEYEIVPVKALIEKTTVQPFSLTARKQYKRKFYAPKIIGKVRNKPRE